jgi:Uma2 family endonuclease
MATLMTAPPAQGGVIFHDVTWDKYEAMLEIVGDRPIRVTYDQGTMEVFMPSFGHEGDAYLLGRMVDTLTEELNIPCKGGGSTTHKRQNLDRGAEPDKCYWFHQNAQRMSGKRRLDLNIDPPPDLIIEVNVTSHSLDRLPIFAAMGTPEVWWLDLETLKFLHLQTNGTYQPNDRSLNFPDLLVGEVARFLSQGRSGEDTAWIRSFRAFVREELIPRDSKKNAGDDNGHGNGPGSIPS